MSKKNKATDEAQIRALVESWAKAVRAKDMDGALSHHARDFLMFDVPMPLQSKGLEEYRKTWELFFDHTP
jgi:ketosteroid isomerase-like protein